MTKLKSTLDELSLLLYEMKCPNQLVFQLVGRAKLLTKKAEEELSAWQEAAEGNLNMLKARDAEGMIYYMNEEDLTLLLPYQYHMLSAEDQKKWVIRVKLVQTEVKDDKERDH